MKWEFLSRVRFTVWHSLPLMILILTDRSPRCLCTSVQSPILKVLGKRELTAALPRTSRASWEAIAVAATASPVKMLASARHFVEVEWRHMLATGTDIHGQITRIHPWRRMRRMNRIWKQQERSPTQHYEGQMKRSFSVYRHLLSLQLFRLSQIQCQEGKRR